MPSLVQLYIAILIVLFSPCLSELRGTKAEVLVIGSESCDFRLARAHQLQAPSSGVNEPHLWVVAVGEWWTEGPVLREVSSQNQEGTGPTCDIPSAGKHPARMVFPPNANATSHWYREHLVAYFNLFLKGK